MIQFSKVDTTFNVSFISAQEIDRINKMEDDEYITPFEEEFSRWMSREPYIPRPFGPARARESAYIPDPITPRPEEMRPLPPPREIHPPESVAVPEMAIRQRKTSTPLPSVVKKNEEKKKTFALTPLDKEYYEPEHKVVTQSELNFIHENFLFIYLLIRVRFKMNVNLDVFNTFLVV